MYSYTTMFSVFADVAFADRAEKIAFAALPATWASPKGKVLQPVTTTLFIRLLLFAIGGDMWAHQYLQVCVVYLASKFYR